MKKFALLLLSLVVIASTAFGECDKKFCVGMVLPLSGPVGQYGAAIRNGVSLAQKENPSDFAQIQFVYEDSEYKPAKAVSSFKKLAEVDRVHLIYTFGGTVSEVVAPIGQQLKIATIISSVDPRAKLGKSYVLRFSNPASDFGKVLGHELERISARKIGIVLTDNYYLNALVRSLEASLSPGFNLTTIATFQPPEQDFRTVIAALKKSMPDALGVFLLPGQVSQFYRELEAQHISVQTFGSDVFESETEIAAAGGAIEGAFIAHHVVADAFRAAYVRQFGDDYQLAYAGQGHDLAKLLAALFGSTGYNIDAVRILDKLRSIKEVTGATGVMRFETSSNGDEFFSFPVALRRIQKGRMVTVEKTF